MMHCVKFKPIDTWFLVNDDIFTFRKLEFGICPRCGKPAAVLIQFNSVKNKFEYIRKSGFESQAFVEEFKKQKQFAASDVNKQKFRTVTYKWVYGVNKSSGKKNKQYAKDFFGNSVLIKEI